MNSIVGVFLTGFKAQSVVLASAAEKTRIVGFDMQMVAQTLFHIVSILLLFYLIGRILLNPVREILQKRKDSIANEYDYIKNEKHKTMDLKKEYEEKLANINKEANEILEEARKKALNKEREIIKEANEEADRLMARASTEIEREKEKAKDEIKVEIIDVAKVLASKFVASSIDKSTSDKLLDETLESMGEETWLN